MTAHIRETVITGGSCAGPGQTQAMVLASAIPTVMQHVA